MSESTAVSALGATSGQIHGTRRTSTDVDTERLHQFVGKMLGEFGGPTSVPLVRIGDALALYKALHGGGPMTAGELAVRTRVHERYLREWLSFTAAWGYLAYDAQSRRFALPPEQAMVFAVDDSPVNMMAAFDRMAAMQKNQARIEGSFRTGGEVRWGDLQCMFCATARFFRPSRQYNLVQLSACVPRRLAFRHPAAQRCSGWRP